jgi:DNA-binding beta-propeller fold protein YncE
MRSARRTAGLIVVLTVFATVASSAYAAGPLGSISQLPSPNNCIGPATECGTTSSTTMAGSEAVVVSPDGKNVYTVNNSDSAISEFTRHADGSLSELPAPNNCIAQSNITTSTCGNRIANGIENPNGIAISPDGNTVYVVGFDSRGVGAIAAFARNAGGSLSQLSGTHNCIGENSGQTDGAVSTCGTVNGQGIADPAAVAVSPGGTNVYVADRSGNAVAEFLRNPDGSLVELGCIADGLGPAQTADCATTTAKGLSGAQSLAISPDGNSVYVGANDSIAEFSRNAAGSLTQLRPGEDCVENIGGTDCDTAAAHGLRGVVSLAVSPDGQNVYSASSDVFFATVTGAVAEFARNTDGSLTQLGGANNCIEENATGQGGTPAAGCGTQTGHGLGCDAAIAVSPDGANVFVDSVSDDCGGRDAVAQFTRRADGSLAQLASPNDCIQEHGVLTPDCGTATGQGVGSRFRAGGLAISPDAANVYTAGDQGGGVVAEFARALPTLTVSLAGAGSGTVSDGTGTISCSPTCSHAYPIGQVVTLTTNPQFGSSFGSWSGAGCSGGATCQVTVTADTAVTATFNLIQTAPSSVLTGAPPSIGGTTAAFTGSVNPGGLSTTAFFQYGLDPKYTGGGPVVYNLSTPPQAVGSDLTTHVVTASVTGLIPNATYHVRLVATNTAGTTLGPDVAFNTLKTAPPGPPALGKTVNVSPVSGIVLILINGQLVPITEAQQIPTNIVIDALHGTITLTTALNGGSGARDASAKSKKHKIKTQTGTFGGAVFKITQAHNGLATLKLVEGAAFNGAPTYATCKAHKAGDATAAALSSKTLQLLRSSAHGKFRTTGRYSAATVRGTKWTIADRCDGTSTHDITDSVAVTDFVRHKTVVLHAGQSYLAKAPKHG